MCRENKSATGIIAYGLKELLVIENGINDEFKWSTRLFAFLFLSVTLRKASIHLFPPNLGQAGLFRFGKVTSQEEKILNSNQLYST